MGECFLSSFSLSPVMQGWGLEHCVKGPLTPKDAGLKLGGDRGSNFEGGKMSVVGDFDLNLMQGYASSPREVLKQTMLGQEVVFRKQVHELHRLYRMQKTLMEDFGWKELDGYNLWKVSTQSKLGPFMNPIQYSPLAEEKTFSSRSTLCSTPSLNKAFLEQNHSDYYSRLQKRPFNLQFPADQHVNHVGKDLLKTGNGWDLRNSVESKHQFYGNNESFSAEVKLTLSIGGDTGKEGNGKSTWNDKIVHSSCNHVIDLEESTDTETNEDAKSVSTSSCAAPITSVKKDLSSGFTLSHSLVVGNESCEGENSFSQGFKEQPNKAFGLDLNKFHPDDFSYVNDPVAACLSTDGSSGACDGLIGEKCEDTFPSATSWSKSNVSCFPESSTILVQYDASNPTLMDVPHSKNSSSPFKGISQTEAFPIDLESMSGPLSEICGELKSDHRTSESGKVDLQLKFTNEDYADVIMDEIEKCGEDTEFPHPCRNGSIVEDVSGDKSPSSCKFDSIADDSSSGAKTMQSGTDFEGSNISPFHQLRKSQSSQSGEQDLRSSDNSEFEHQFCNKKKEETDDGDFLIQKAADSLIHFSLGSSNKNQDCWFNAGTNGIENEGRDKPQRSLDSYESMVLKLTESSVDDYCVSSKPLEVNKTDKKDCGIKLRRGRRLKDFQRDVLPGLASLSRHEIREDVSIMEAVIRSREYKRMRSKMDGGGNWFKPVKSRRSRLHYVGRRY